MQDIQASKLPEEHRKGVDAAKCCERDADGKGSKNTHPLVSVIIPTYNCAHYLEEAVESVFGQTYSPLECIVIDDGSTDRTDEVLTKLLARYPELKVARKTNGGLSSARNAGLRVASGDFVSFLDADDVLLPHKIERQVEFLNVHPDVGLVYSDYLVVSENLHPIATFAAEMPRELDPLDAFCYRNWFNSLVTLIRRTAIDKIGEFDEELAVAEDWDYWIRCAKVAQICYLGGPAALYRQHGGQLHRNHLHMRRACIQVAIKNFRESRKRLRAAMAAIELTYAKDLWRKRNIAATLVSLIRYAFRYRFGLHTGNVLRQFEAITQSQLKSI